MFGDRSLSSPHPRCYDEGTGVGCVAAWGLIPGVSFLGLVVTGQDSPSTVPRAEPGFVGLMLL